jgi:AraC-like DNA-binding protein
MVTEDLMEELMEDAEQDALTRLQNKIGENIHMDNMAPRELAQVKEKLFQTMASSWDDSLLTRFQTLILNDQLFLQPSLSLADVAEKLHTNKTYVSKMVNNAYNMSFPELLNILRIDYAEQYILNHPDAKQAEIAQVCGFLSASSFNNMFKKVTGLTPKMWLATSESK